MTSEHTVYSYISVIFSHYNVGWFNALPIILVFFGIGAVIGNFIAGYGTDKFGAKAVLIFSVLVQTIDLLLLSFFINKFYCRVQLSLFGALQDGCILFLFNIDCLACRRSTAYLQFH